MQEPKND